MACGPFDVGQHCWDRMICRQFRVRRGSTQKINYQFIFSTTRNLAFPLSMRSATPQPPRPTETSRSWGGCRSTPQSRIASAESVPLRAEGQRFTARRASTVQQAKHFDVSRPPRRSPPAFHRLRPATSGDIDFASGAVAGIVVAAQLCSASAGFSAFIIDVVIPRAQQPTKSFLVLAAPDGPLCRIPSCLARIPQMPQSHEAHRIRHDIARHRASMTKRVERRDPGITKRSRFFGNRASGDRGQPLRRSHHVFLIASMAEPSPESARVHQTANFPRPAGWQTVQCPPIQPMPTRPARAFRSTVALFPAHQSHFGDFVARDPRVVIPGNRLSFCNHVAMTEKRKPPPSRELFQDPDRGWTFGTGFNGAVGDRDCATRMVGRCAIGQSRHRKVK